MRMRGGWLRFGVGLALVSALAVRESAAWGADGHRMINRLADAALPKDVPEFLRSPEAQAALEFYGPQPDHWKSQAEPELAASGSPEHFIDLEYADLIGPTLPRRRYDYIRALAVAQKAHPDLPLSPEKVGLQPYAATETWERLKSDLRDYRQLEADHKDVKPIECEILFDAGVLGHWVGDGSQPLHVTIQYNGWTGPNPNNYTTEHQIHAQFESDFVKATVKPERDVAPLIPVKPELIGDVFDQYMVYLRHSNSLVERTYQLEKAGGFNGDGTPASRAFVDERLAAGATELRDLIYTAWVRSADPVPQYRNSRRVKPSDD
jgi:hypothetical protein